MTDTAASGLRIVLKDVHPMLDGDYPLEPDSFTMRDIHDIKRLAGVLPKDFNDALGKGDTDLVLALSVIALRQAGKRPDEDALWDAPIGTIQLVGEEPSVLPPAETASPMNGSDAEQNDANDRSGTSSSNGSDPPAVSPSVTGAPV